MILYLFKSAICLLILWGIYKLILESEKLHVFKRFYLLLSIVFAFIIPVVSIELPSGPKENGLIVFKKTLEVPQSVLETAPTIETPEMQTIIPWLDYFIVLSSFISLLFLVRFFNNLISVLRSIQRSRVIKWQSAKLVLLDKRILPHTFLNYIFVDKIHYENGRIEPELFSHELAHVRQKHSLDVILLELLRIIFWFNPLIYLFKQAIQLNHEFLADETVNKTHRDVKAYQYLLLSKASEASGLSLTSNLNFQITKKRLLMMTKNTSQSTAFVKKAMCMLLFVTLAFCLADFQSMAQEPANLKTAPPAVAVVSKPRRLTKEDVNYQNGQVMIRVKGGLPVLKQYNELTDEEKSQNFKLFYWDKASPTQEEMNKWKDPKIFGIWINGKRVSNSEVSKYHPNDIAHFSTSRLLGKAKTHGKHIYQLDIMTNDYYDSVYIKGVKESPFLIIEKPEKKDKN